jgi:hypothetical protein
MTLKDVMRSGWTIPVRLLVGVATLAFRASSCTDRQDYS